VRWQSAAATALWLECFRLETNRESKPVSRYACHRAPRVVRGQASAKRQPIAKLSDFFLCNWVVHAPVVDETGLTGEYDWELPYQPGQPNIALQALKDNLGLELVKARRSINMLVVERDETVQKH
jgi:uncharacterized protein (TIGR03435 family)